MRRFYAPPEQIRDGTVELDAGETSHLRNVLRLRPGDEAAVFDGQGNEYRCTIESVEKLASRLNVLDTTEPASPESTLDLTLAAAILKHDRFDLVVQKAVELGVNVLVPLEVVRFDVRPADALRRYDRWRRIAMEATKQCGRARLMRIDEQRSFDEVIAGADAATTIMFSERQGAALPKSIAGGRLTALIGPVGGWDDRELTAASARGIPVATLGGRVMRAETAAIAIAAILQHRYGDLN